MSTVKKLLDLDPRIIYAMMFVALAFPILNPVVLPMDIQAYSQEAFDFIDGIPDGSIVLVEGGLGAATYPQGGPGMVVNIVHMLQKEIKIVFFSLGPEQNVWTMTGIEAALDKLPAGVEAVEGVNWVHLGYIPGGESGVSAFANDIRSVLTVDYHETPIDDLPMMDDINDASSFTAIVWWGGSEGSIPYGIRQLVTPFGIPMTGMSTTNEVANYSPYIDAGQLKGIFGGVRGSAEYEYLMNMPGPALGQAMATNFGGLLWVAFVIFGNVFYLINKTMEEN